MLAMSAGPDERRLHSTAEWKGVQLSPRQAGQGHRAGPLDEASFASVTLSAVQTLLTLPPERKSCSLARKAVRVFCHTHNMTPLADDAELLTSELVGNAVEHAGGLIVLAAEARAGWLTVMVTDGNARPPLGRNTDPQFLEERGRGMLVVEAIASDWGTTRRGSGKCVWFRLP
jgi:anti-sigma regulatory factor (Ser/Thr protein kinase)